MAITPQASQPEIWLKNPTMVKVRAKLGTWSGEDVVAYARFRFNTNLLTKQQVADLAKELVAPNLPKAGAEFYAGGVVSTSTIPVAIVMKANGPFKRADMAGTTHWYLSGNRAELWHGTVASAVRWALEQAHIDPRKTWAEAIQRWRHAHRTKRVSGHDLGTIPVHPILDKALSNQMAAEEKMLVGLPSNGGIKKQYWGLMPGDRLTSPDHPTLVVKNVRCNLGTPPTVALEEPVDA